MIEVRVDDLLFVEAGAVLRPVGSDGLAITPVSRRLELHMGPVARGRLQAMGELPVGGATITEGGELGVSFLIHVVLRSPEQETTAALMRLALLNGLRRAAEWGIETLALPPLGTGAGNLETETAAAVMIPMILEHQARYPCPREVLIIVESEYEKSVFEGMLKPVG
ncbi:MAG: macro domain-containing protein [Gemmatimonadetes bacterium]|nr:macro domain-containing protein [Gemmatimonadota bacterium]